EEEDRGVAAPARQPVRVLRAQPEHRRDQHGQQGAPKGDAEPHPPPHDSSGHVFTTPKTKSPTVASAARLSAARRRLQCWMATGRRTGASARNSATRFRASRLSEARSWVGLATPRVAANASAISSSVK